MTTVDNFLATCIEGFTSTSTISSSQNKTNKPTELMKQHITVTDSCYPLILNMEDVF